MAGFPAADLTGKIFGRLTVVAREQRSGDRQYWLCRCACNAIVSIRSDGLKNGRAWSCGCGKIEKLTSHSDSKSPEFLAWTSMLQRCENPNSGPYKYYGALGIIVCERWHIYENFLADVGRKPSPIYSLDRWPDPRGNYEPSNVRWATARQQSNNRRNTKFVEFDGRLVPVSELAEQHGISRATLTSRLKRGWPITKALSRTSL